MDKPSDNIKEYAFTLPLTPKVKVTSTSHNNLYDIIDYPDICDQIVTQSNVKKREKSAIESLMTSCL